MRIPIRKQLRPIAEKYELRLIALFGSQVSGHTHPESDVDVAVWAENHLSFARQSKLWRELSDAVGAEVDLSVLNHAEPLLLYVVSRQGRLLYENKRRAWEEYRGYAFRYYCDTHDLRDALDRDTRRRIRAWGHA